VLKVQAPKEQNTTLLMARPETCRQARALTLTSQVQHKTLSLEEQDLVPELVETLVQEQALEHPVVVLQDPGPEEELELVELELVVELALADLALEVALELEALVLRLIHNSYIILKQ
jgi:hypothetical protein